MTSVSRRRAIVLALSAHLLVAFGPAAAPVTFERTPLAVQTAKGTYTFTVEIADTDARRSLGLMHRTAMPADHGMLFDFKADENVAMWMRNTRIPLDMLFIDRNGRIVNIAERTVPYSEATIPSKGPVRAVLELNGGTVARLGIKPGDRVLHPIFRNAG